MSKQDDLIAVAAAKVQKIYDERTAGDHTFTGILAEFAQHFVRVHEEAKYAEFQAQYVTVERDWPAFDLRPFAQGLITQTKSVKCRCGDYAGTSEKDLVEHVMAMMHVEDGKSHG